MAMKLSEAARRVIELAWKIRDYWDAELPKRHPDYPLVNPGEDDGPPPPEEAKLRGLLEGLPEDMLYKLFFLMRYGRGGAEPGDLAQAFRELKEEFPERDEVVEMMMFQAPLAAYLEDGLDRLRDLKIDPDRFLVSKPARPRR